MLVDVEEVGMIGLRLLMFGGVMIEKVSVVLCGERLVSVRVLVVFWLILIFRC